MSKEDLKHDFIYLRHIPNIRKTEEEFEIYTKMCEERGYPKPDRNSRIRPLHEKIDEETRKKIIARAKHKKS